eukprot:Sspe_Gene.57610::Locus_31601_Transcript_3_3_Confidence_0.667_Length_1480::g.57610::m.57610
MIRAALCVAALAVVLCGLHEVYPVFDAPHLCSRPDDFTLNPLTNVGCFFTSSYFDSRARFVAHVEKLGCKHTASIPVADGVTIDFALFLRNPKKLLLHISGTHGTEGFVGSATQTALLREALRNGNSLNFEGKEDESSPSVLMVHAVNAYGMANYRRWNEDGIDINRNALFDGFDEVLQRDHNVAGYENYSHVFNPPTAPSNVQYVLSLMKNLHKVLFDQTSIKRAAVAAQYHNNKGIFYGGRELSKSHRAVRDFIQKHQLDKTVENLVLIDLHTGLGPMGLDTLLTNNKHDAVRKTFCNEKTFRYAKKAPLVDKDMGSDADAVGVSEGYELTKGTISENYPKLFPARKHTVSITQEFGTLPGVLVMRAMVLENQAEHYLSTPEEKAPWKDLIFHAFNVHRHTFQQSTVERGMELFHQGYQCLLAGNACMAKL